MSAASYAIPWTTVTQVTAGMSGGPMPPPSGSAQGPRPHRRRGQALERGAGRRPDLGHRREPRRHRGLRKGDVVLRIGGVRATSLIDANRLTRADTGQPIAVAYLRDGKVARATIAADATDHHDGRRVELTQGLSGSGPAAVRPRQRRRQVRRCRPRPHPATAPGAGAGRSVAHGPARKAAT